MFLQQAAVLSCHFPLEILFLGVLENIARLSAKAQYKALAQASTNILWINSLLQELSCSLSSKLILWCDTQSANSLAHNPIFHVPTKRTVIDIHFIREKDDAGLFEIRYIPFDILFF